MIIDKVRKNGLKIEKKVFKPQRQEIASLIWLMRKVDKKLAAQLMGDYQEGIKKMRDDAVNEVLHNVTLRFGGLNNGSDPHTKH